MTKSNQPKKQHFAYIVQCADNTLYSGYATDLAKRVAEHNGEREQKAAASKYTRARRPVELVHAEEFTTRSEAMKREAAFKKLSRTEKLELINGK